MWCELESRRLPAAVGIILTTLGLAARKHRVELCALLRRQQAVHTVQHDGALGGEICARLFRLPDLSRDDGDIRGPFLDEAGHRVVELVQLFLCGASDGSVA